MLINSILKYASVLLLVNSALAEVERNDCKELREMFKKKEEFINECKINSKGELIELNIINKVKYGNDDDNPVLNLNNEDNDKILSYNTIKKLVYSIDNWETVSYDDDFSIPQIGQLTNLEELTIYRHITEDGMACTGSYFIGPVNVNSIPENSKNLKKLYLKQVSISKELADKILSLTSLEELCDGLTNLASSKLVDKSNLNFVSIKKPLYGDECGEPDTLEKNMTNLFKNIKRLEINDLILKQKDFDDITEITNLEELSLFFVENLKLDNLKNLEKLTKLELVGSYKFNSKFIPNSIKSLILWEEVSQSDISETSKLTNLEELYINVGYEKLNLDSLKNLENLSTLEIYNSNENKIPEVIYSLKNLVHLTIGNNGISSIPSKLINLKNLEYLSLFGNDITEIPSDINKLVNLKTLDLSENKIEKIPNEIGDLVNLEVLDLSENKIKKIPKEIGDLVNLEVLKLTSNIIFDELPKSLNNLTHLKEIKLDGNEDIYGEILTNESLDTCIYLEKYSLCQTKEVRCLDITFENCSSDDNNKIKCGIHGKRCPYGTCCGKDGYCSTTDESCSLEFGCQREYGICNDECSDFTKDLSLVLSSDYYDMCTIDDKGKMISLSIDEFYIDEDEGIGYGVTLDDIKKLSSYKSLNTIGYVARKDGEKYIEEINKSVPTLKKLILESIYLYDNKVFPKGLFDEISKMKNLEKLKLSNIRNDENISFDKLKNIKELDIYINEIRSGSQTLIDEISKIENLEKLTIDLLSNRKISLDKLKNLTHLKEIIMSDISFKDIKNIKSLEKLTLDNIESSSLFKEISYLSSLKEINLERVYFDDDDLSYLKNLKLESFITNVENDRKNIPKYLLEIPTLKVLKIEYGNTENIQKEITNLKDLEELELGGLSEIPDYLYQLEKLSYLSLRNGKISNIPDLTVFKNLTILNLRGNKIKEIPKSLGKITTLTDLNISENKITEVPDELKNLSNLKYLDLSLNSLTKFPSVLENFTKLESLDLSSNNINDELPEYLNSFPNLKRVDFGENKDVYGQTLTNENLTECVYDINYNLCIPKITKCLDYDFDLCNNSETKITTPIATATATTTTTRPTGATTTITKEVTTTITSKKLTTIDIPTLTTTTTTTTTPKPTIKGRCGNKFDNVKCPSGECCSKYGYCGRSSNHCDISKGCQSEFGECTTKNTKGKCGKEYGQCPLGQCCSKYGYCGKSSDYCDISKGCQSEFGKCTTKNTKGRCGKDFDNAKCSSGECCSKYGYCGRSSDHCDVSKGCQSEFGECITKNTKGRCGKDFDNAKCSSGECCSKYGYCGRSSDHCDVSKGCQSEFGECITKNTKGRCGKDFDNAKCSSGECCSKYGYCGRSSDHCKLSKGCQSEFGKCS